MNLKSLQSVLDDESLLNKKAYQYKIDKEVLRTEYELAVLVHKAQDSEDVELVKQAMDKLVEYQKLNNL